MKIANNPNISTKFESSLSNTDLSSALQTKGMFANVQDFFVRLITKSQDSLITKTQQDTNFQPTVKQDTSYENVRLDNVRTQVKDNNQSTKETNKNHKDNKTKKSPQYRKAQTTEDKASNEKIIHEELTVAEHEAALTSNSSTTNPKNNQITELVDNYTPQKTNSDNLELSPEQENGQQQLILQNQTQQLTLIQQRATEETTNFPPLTQQTELTTAETSSLRNTSEKIVELALSTQAQITAQNNFTLNTQNKLDSKLPEQSQTQISQNLSAEETYFFDELAQTNTANTFALENQELQTIAKTLQLEEKPEEQKSFITNLIAQTKAEQVTFESKVALTEKLAQLKQELNFPKNSNEQVANTQAKIQESDLQQGKSAFVPEIPALVTNNQTTIQAQTQTQAEQVLPNPLAITGLANNIVAQESSENIAPQESVSKVKNFLSNQNLTTQVLVSTNNLSDKTTNTFKNLSAKLQETVVGKIKDLLENVTRTRTTQSMVVRLDPPQLGEITLKITQREDKIFARIIPESKEVELNLKANSAEIMNVLASSGIKVENISLSFGFDNFGQNTSGFEKMFAGYNFNDNQHLTGGARYAEKFGRLDKTAQENELNTGTENYNATQTGWVA
ncbi:MAG: flagellar hook-length control protein FliK [Deltaproteobacteria bacterium]|jgi:flagellar hook-length control protein FliK|nr:flagellar hook-length control protein FliK [Deltaproteobacteria bacterium]